MFAHQAALLTVAAIVGNIQGADAIGTENESTILKMPLDDFTRARITREFKLIKYEKERINKEIEAFKKALAEIGAKEKDSRINREKGIQEFEAGMKLIREREVQLAWKISEIEWKIRGMRQWKKLKQARKA